MNNKFVKIYINDESGLHLQTHFIRVDKWDVPSGKIEIDESPRQAAVRELLERTGFEIDSEKLKDCGIEGDFVVFKGYKKDLVEIAEPGERGGYKTQVRWI